MKIRIQLFGALREADPSGQVALDVPDGCSVAQLRDALQAHLAEHAPHVSAALVSRSALASDETVLRNDDAVPANGPLAVLPPVSGG